MDSLTFADIRDSWDRTGSWVGVHYDDERCDGRSEHSATGGRTRKSSSSGKRGYEYTKLDETLGTKCHDDTIAGVMLWCVEFLGWKMKCRCVYGGGKRREEESEKQSEKSRKDGLR